MSDVVLVPGWLDTPSLFARLMRRLEGAGLEPHGFPLPDRTGATRIEELATALATWVDQRIPPGRKFHLVGFSMGALVARYYVQRLGGDARVLRLVAVSPPTRGTWTAWLLPLPGVRQMRPGSEFLRDLNADTATLEAARYAAIWSRIDYMIVPPETSRLGIGEEVRLTVPFHFWIPRSSRVSREVLRLLGHTPCPPPPA